MILIFGTCFESNLDYYQFRLLVREMQQDRDQDDRGPDLQASSDFVEFVCQIVVTMVNTMFILVTFICFMCVIFIICTNRRSLSNKYFRRFILRHIILIFLFLSRYATLTIVTQLIPFDDPKLFDFSSKAL